MLSTLIDAAEEAPASFEDARAYFRANLQGRTIKTAIGGVLIKGSTWGEMKRGMKQDPLKIALVPFIEEILTKGKAGPREALYKPRADGFVAFHFISRIVSVGAQRVQAGVTVGERADGALQYVAYGLQHSKSKQWAAHKSEAPSGVPGQEPGADGAKAVKKLDGVGSVPPDDAAVNGPDDGLNIHILRVLDDAGRVLSTLERLKLAGELRSAGQALRYSDPPAARRVALTRKASGLRATLLGKRQAGIEDLDLFNSAQSIPLLRAHFESLKGADEVTRTQAAGYLSIITGRVNLLASQAGENVAWDSPGMALRSDVENANQAQKMSYKAAQYAKFTTAGADVMGIPEKMAAGVALIASLAAADQAIIDEWNKAHAAGAAALSVAEDEARKAYAAVVDGGGTREQATVIWAAYTAQREAFYTAVREKFQPQRDANAEAKKQATLEMSAAAADLKRDILAKSPVTQEEADTWAAAQEVSAGARAALKKKGYDPVQARADMAEFYRLTGGRLAKVMIRTSRGRASAEGIHGHSSSIINMGANFDKRVLFHELAHHLERDPVAVAAAKGFLERRRESEKVYTLRSLTGNNAYATKEVAHKDHWFNHYVGKVYNYDVTEVMSMGVESFCDDFTLASRIQQDPEHFALIAGFMRTPPDPLFKAVKQVFAQQADAETEVADVRADERETSLASLATGVTLTKLDPPPAEYPWLDQSKGVYVGSYSSIHVYLCKALRNPKTKRKGTGYMLIYIGQREGRNWSTNTMEMMPSWRTSTVFGPEVEARAAARLWASNPDSYLPSLEDTEKLKQFAKAYAS